jgi:hypothetical protein
MKKSFLAEALAVVLLAAILLQVSPTTSSLTPTAINGTQQAPL